MNLTGRGRQLIDEGNDERYRWVDELTGKFNADERDQVVKALERMMRAIREREEEPVR